MLGPAGLKFAPVQRFKRHAIPPLFARMQSFEFFTGLGPPRWLIFFFVELRARAKRNVPLTAAAFPSFSLLPAIYVYMYIVHFPLFLDSNVRTFCFNHPRCPSIPFLSDFCVSWNFYVTLFLDFLNSYFRHIDELLFFHSVRNNRFLVFLKKLIYNLFVSFNRRKKTRGKNIFVSQSV